MKYHPRIIFILTSLVVMLLSGCAPTKPYVLADYQRDPEFNMLELLATGVVLGGVTVSAYPVTVEERNALTKQLEDVLTQFSLYRINTPIKLSERVGNELYEQLMEYFYKNRTLKVEDFSELQSLYTPARYILFVHIDSDQTRQHTVHHSGALEYRSIRIVTGRMYIFNLDTAQTTLYTRIAIRDVNSNNVQQVSGGASLSILLGNVVAQVALGGYPELPTKEHAMYRFFLGVADQIPSN